MTTAATTAATTPTGTAPERTGGDARARVLAACRSMDAAGGPLPVAQLAAAAGWSERQLTRQFAAVLATSPHAYGQTVRSERLRPALREASTVTGAAFDAGYGSVRAFYETGAARLGMSAARYAAGGDGERLLFTAAPVQVAGGGADPGADVALLAVVSLSGVVAVRLGPDVDALLAEVRAELPRADLVREDEALTDVRTALQALALGASAPDLPLDVRGTAFQARVWAALREVPRGQTRSYAQVAAELGHPTAVRAVARACATNPAALVTPCHRVVRSDGGLGGFRWGLHVKEALLRAERS